ncbi:MAG: ArsR family transcriptional regulator [Chloroflexota bacterium]|nr:ArsR family transcriptional regulator [Chloroflexota bacterium]
MQATRERILKILKERGEATVKELSETLGLTTVTIRHHLDTLRREDLVAAPSVRHRKAPGRPQHVYALTNEASDFFPKRYERLIDLMFEELYARLSRDEVESMMENIGKRIADGVTIPRGADLEERVVVTVNFMDTRGYMAHWEETEDGDYLIHVANCPYEGVSRRHGEVCKIDQTLLRELLGAASEDIRRVPAPPRRCAYLVKPA